MTKNGTGVDMSGDNIEFVMFLLSLFQFAFVVMLEYVLVRLEWGEDKYCSCHHHSLEKVCPECKKEKKPSKWDFSAGHAIAVSLLMMTGNPDWLIVGTFATMFRFWAASLVGSAKRASLHPQFGELHLLLLESIETSRRTVTNNLKSDYFLPRLSAWHLTELSWTLLSVALCFIDPYLQLAVSTVVVIDIVMFDSRLGLYLARTNWLARFNQPPRGAETAPIEPTLESQIRTLESVSKLLSEDSCDRDFKASLLDIKASIKEDLRKRFPTMKFAKDPAQAVQNPAQ